MPIGPRRFKWLRSMAAVLAEVTAPSPARIARAASDLRHGLTLPAPACMPPLQRAIKVLNQASPRDVQAMVMLGQALRRMADLHQGAQALQYRARAVAKLQEQIRRQGPRADFALLMAYGDSWGPLAHEDPKAEMVQRQHQRQLALREQALKVAQTDAERASALLALALHHAALARHPLSEDPAGQTTAAAKHLAQAVALKALDPEQRHAAEDLAQSLRLD